MNTKPASSVSARRFVALLSKETRQILRDPSTGLIAFVLPLILLFLFGYGVNLDTGRTRIGLSVRDDSEAASTSLAISRTEAGSTFARRARCSAAVKISFADRSVASSPLPTALV